MKVQFRSILFALVLPAAACGGDRETSTVTTSQSEPSTLQPTSEAPVATPAPPVARETPKIVEVAAPLPTKYDEALAKGRELLARGEYGDAKVMLEVAIELDDKKAEPHVEMARLYIATSERGKAIASAKQAIKRAPLSSQVWNTKGRAELAAHNYDNAIEAFSKAIELNDNNVFAWNNLGYTELLLEQFDDAAEHLTEATSRNGATGYMFNNLGVALEHLDRLDEARLAYEAGGKLGSTSAAASRKRLEGVESIAIAAADDTQASVHDEVRGEAQFKEYALTDEGDITDEDRAMETAGSGASEELESEPADDMGDEIGDEDMGDEIGDDSAQLDDAELDEPEVVELAPTE